MKITFLSFTNGHNIIFYIKRGQNLENNVKKLKNYKVLPFVFTSKCTKKISCIFIKKIEKHMYYIHI